MMPLSLLFFLLQAFLLLVKTPPETKDGFAIFKQAILSDIILRLGASVS